MKERTFNIILISVIVLLVGCLIYIGYTFKRCPDRTPCPQYTAPAPKTDTIYLTQIKYIKEKRHETNPYIARPVIAISVFDSIAKYYAY